MSRSPPARTSVRTSSSASSSSSSSSSSVRRSPPLSRSPPARTPSLSRSPPARTPSSRSPPARAASLGRSPPSTSKGKNSSPAPVAKERRAPFPAWFPAWSGGTSILALPPDILLQNLFCSLPLKSCLRLRRVCRAWNALIDKPYMQYLLRCREQEMALQTQKAALADRLKVCLTRLIPVVATSLHWHKLLSQERPLCCLAQALCATHVLVDPGATGELAQALSLVCVDKDKRMPLLNAVVVFSNFTVHTVSVAQLRRARALINATPAGFLLDLEEGVRDLRDWVAAALDFEPLVMLLGRQLAPLKL